MTDDMDIPTETLSETEHYMIWASEEPDGETVYHIDLGLATIHFFAEEFEEFLSLVRGVRRL